MPNLSSTPQTVKSIAEIAPIDSIIIDCFYVAYRSFCVTPPFYSDKGIPTNAIQGLISSVRKMVRELKPANVLIATESQYNIRDDISSTYKAGRVLPPEFAIQLDYLYALCDAAGWHVVSCHGYEADDVIATIGRQLQITNHKGIVFTTDKDIIARVSKSSGIIGIYRVEKGHSQILDEAYYTTKWGINPQQIPEVLALCGDSVDNIAGLPGVGLKTATKLIQQFRTVDNMLNHIPEVNPIKLRNLLQQPESQTAISHSQSLLKLQDQLPIPDYVFQPKQANPQKFQDLLQALNIKKT